ncbi:MAG: hypothetical protein ACI8S6_004341 [Myxococcota bacterium]|jgi:hypothetical protein
MSVLPRDRALVWCVGAAALSGAVHVPGLLSPAVRADELVYVAAFVAADAGLPLSGVAGWYYPAPLAQAGAALGSGATLVLWRLGNLLGSALTCGAAGRVLGGGRIGLGLAMAAALMWSPPVTEGIAVGNVSGLVCGLILAASMMPWLASSVLLAGTFVFKPLALAAVLGRPVRAALLPIGAATLAMWASPGRGALLNLTATSNASPAGVLAEWGLPWQVWTASVLVVAVVWGRGSWSRGLCLGWLSVPLAWTHTGVLLVVPWAWALAGSQAEPQRDRRLLRQLVLLFAGVVVVRAGMFAVEGFSALRLLPGFAAVLIAVWSGSGSGGVSLRRG